MVFCFFCKDEKVFDLFFLECNVNYIGELRKKFVNVFYGWVVIYFFWMDFLLFINVNELIIFFKGIFEDKNKYGYGGYYFLMKFFENGIVEMVVDYNEESLMKKL